MLRFRIATVALLLAASLTATAQDAGFWKATSNTARSITGDISFGGDKVMISFSTYTIAQVRTLNAAEVNAVFNADASGTAHGNVYALSIPAKKYFQHKNTLCGAEDTQYMATCASGKELQVAFFSGSKLPVFTPDALANSTALCGTFTYSR